MIHRLMIMSSHAVFATLWISLSLGLTTCAWGEAMQLLTLPSRVSAAPYLMKFSMESVGGNGYHPFVLEFTPRGAKFARDHHLQVTIKPRRTYGSELNFSFRQSITLNEGANIQTTVVYVPSYIPWDEVRVSLAEDGKQIKSGTTSNGIFDRQKRMKQKVSVGVFVDDIKKNSSSKTATVPDARTLMTVLGDGPIVEDAKKKRLNNSQATNFLKKVQPAWVQFRILSETDAYTQWIGHSQLDVIIVSAPALQRMSDNRPEQYLAIQKWLAAGGNLWVYATDAQQSELLKTFPREPIDDSKIVRKFKVASRMKLKSVNDTSSLTNDYWNGVRKGSSNSGRSSFKKRGEIVKEMEKTGHQFANKASWQKIKEKLQIGRIGLGTVIMIKDEDPFPGSFQFWQTVADLSGDRLTWGNRFGVELPSGNDTYWNWLIPSVGKPPVKSFVVLNLAFTILIGPLCYFFLRRHRRLYLLYFVAPLFAFLVSGSLFLYAIGTDGLTTKIRSRQLTWVDPSSGFSIDQSRQTYYAVMGQSDGVVQSLDTAIFPVHGTPLVYNYYSQQSKRNGEITVEENGRRMTGIFLPPRDQVQYLSTRPYPSQQNVSFLPNSDGPPTIENNLDHPILQIVSRDNDGTFWHAGEIAMGKSSSMERATQTSAKDLLVPAVIPPDQAVPILQRNTSYYGNQYGSVVQSCLLEQRMKHWTTNMPNGTFIAIAPLENKRMGVAKAEVKDSVHLIMGKLHATNQANAGDTN